MNIQKFFGIELPVIQAPMAGVQTSVLAIAVSNAGGLGSLPCAMLTPESLREELAAITAQTGRPYNVNFFCHTPAVPDPAREARWRAALAPYYAEFGIDPAAVPAGGERLPFSSELADVLAAFRPPVVSFHFGLPSPELMQRVKSWGAKVLSSATTVAEARWLEANGADAIIAQGLEAGGHRGNFLSEDLTTQAGTMALLPQVLRAVRVPVIAAGGIADARGVKAALALGAAGVQVGTSYLLCSEATTTALHRAALKSERAQHTVLTNLITGRPARGIYNRLMRELGPLSDLAPAFPRAASALMPLKAAAEKLGRDDFSTLWSGQNASGCREIPAAEMTRWLAATLPRVNLIYARAANGVIGKDGVMPWHLPEDLAHFKRLTQGWPVIMGRKTWDSLPPRFRPLPGRTNIVVTRQTGWQETGAQRAPSLAHALELCKESAEVWIIGGAQIYAQAEPLAQRVEATEIAQDFEGDAYAPVLGCHWMAATRENHTSVNGMAFNFVTYLRKPAALAAE